MHIALCCNSDTEHLKNVLSEYGEVIVFFGARDRLPGVDLGYYLIRGEPCDLVVVAMDGAAGMNDCWQIKRIKKDLPILWISEQDGFFQESRRIGVEEFLVKPVPDGMLKKCVKHLLKEMQYREPVEVIGT